MTDITPRSKTSKYYILAKDGKTPKRERNEKKFYEWLERVKTRKIKQEQIGQYFVSTVFVGVDDFPSNDPPILWETTLYDKERSYVMGRYSSYDSAVDGHYKLSVWAKVKTEEQNADQLTRKGETR